MLRFKELKELDRDRIIQILSNNRVGVSVHYIPMAMMTYFKSVGYDIADYPKTFKHYQNEISLPIYNGLSEAQVSYTIEQVLSAYNEIK